MKLHIYTVPIAYLAEQFTMTNTNKCQAWVAMALFNNTLQPAYVWTLTTLPTLVLQDSIKQYSQGTILEFTRLHMYHYTQAHTYTPVLYKRVCALQVCNNNNS